MMLLSLDYQVINMEKLYTEDELKSAYSAGHATGSEEAFAAGYDAGFNSSCNDVEVDEESLQSFENFLDMLKKEHAEAENKRQYERNR